MIIEEVSEKSVVLLRECKKNSLNLREIKLSRTLVINKQVPAGKE